MKLRPLIRIIKILGIFIIGILLLLLISYVLLRQAGVQTWIANRILHSIEADTGGKASVERIFARFPSTLEMDAFLLEDAQGDTMAYAGKLRVTIEIFRPRKRIIGIDKVTLDDARIFLNTTPGASNLPPFFSRNDPEEKPKGKPTKPYHLDVRELEINRAYFELRNDSSTSVVPASFEKLTASVRDIDLGEQRLNFRSLELVAPRVYIAGQGKTTSPVELTRLAPETGWQIGIDRLSISDGYFERWADLNAPTDAASLLDMNHLQLEELSFRAKNFRMDSVISVEVIALSGSAGDQVRLKETEGSLLVTANGYVIKNLRIGLNESRLEMNNTGTISNFDQLVRSLHQDIRLKAVLEPSDFALFLPAGKSIRHTVYLELNGRGTPGNLQITHLNARAKGARLLASGVVRGLPNTDNLSYDLQIQELTASAGAIRQMVPWVDIPEEVDPLGVVTAKGTVDGNLQNVATNLEVTTAAGGFTTGLELGNIKGILQYKGTMDVGSFDLATILPGTPVGKVSGLLALNGSGMEFKDIEADITGHLNFLELQGYTYRDVDIEGRVSDRVFDGRLNVTDECLGLEFTGMLDLSDSLPAIDCQMHIDMADLQTLGLMKDKLIVSLDGDFELTGNRPDNMNGTMHLNGLQLMNDNSEVQFDTTLFTISNRDGYTQYNLINEDLIVSVSGYFDPLVLPREIRRSLSEHIYYVNFTDTIPKQKQQIQGSISLAEGFGLTKFLIGNIDLPENLEADFIFDNSRDLIRLNAHSNYVGYKKFGIDTFDVKLNTRDDAMMLRASVAAVNIIGSKFKIDDIGLRTTSTKNHINWNLEVESPNSPNRIVLAPELEFLADSMVLHFNDSYLRLNSMDWPFNEANELVFKQDAVIARNFSIHNNDQYLEIVNASSDLSDVSLEFSRLDIPALANIAQLDTIIRGGFLSGIIRFHDPLGELSADIGLLFDSLQVFEFYCNQLAIDGYYDRVVNDIQLAADFVDPNYDLTAVGSYDLSPGVQQPINLDIDVRSLDLSFLDKILKYKANIYAHGRGQMQFVGSFKEPTLLGSATVNDTGRVYIDFLGIDMLMIEEDVFFTENSIDFQSVNLFDPFGNQAFLEGKLTHQHFKDVSLSATLATDNFNVLNTTSFDNEEFYGRAFGDGLVTFSGLTRNINMEIDMKTNPGTKVSIPVSQAGDTKNYDDIIFVQPGDTTLIRQVADRIEIKGVNLDFQLEVTPDAELEIVLNTESDNNLTAHGQGDLDLRIDQNKQLSIYGRYDIRDGKYVFSPQNLLNKRFEIQNGSYINWTGKPFEAELFVNALYNVNARVDNILEDSTQAYQTVPMDVVINIGGTLDQTDVSFDIKTQQTGLTRVPDEVTIFLNDIKDDQGEVTTQAIALLIVNRFLPSNTTVFAGTSLSAGDFGKTTAFELISNQVSNYLTDAISKLITEAELNFNFTQRENSSIESPGQTTEFQVDFKTSFVQNRIIVKVGGNFEVNDQESTQENTIAGDFEVEGLLTKDGRLRGKAYHRTADYDIFNQDRSKTGVGISYQKDFDNIGEVFKTDPLKTQRRKDKRRDRRDQREDEQKRREREAGTLVTEE